MLYSWKKGLKTGSYYTNVTTAAEAQKFTIKDYEEIKLNVKEFKLDYNISYDESDEEEICLMCGS
jgi:S-adenosylmethionine hydrolase